MATTSPTKQGPGGQQIAANLLSPEARAACERIAAGEAPWSQRAQALLAVDEGATQAEAGQRVGLTQGQVKYWVGKFRRDQLGIFPEAGLPVGAEENEKNAAQAKKKPKQKSKKAKKDKTGKKPKKKKKAQKDKKGKKSKKAKQGKR